MTDRAIIAGMERRHLAAVPDQPTLDDVARTAAWEAFGKATKAPTLTPTDRLRRYAEACLIAGETHTRATDEASA